MGFAAPTSESALNIDPVYVVAPLPEPEEGTRRLFLGGAIGLFVGVLAGGAGGYWLASPSEGPAQAPDDELALLHWLATEAPVDHLLEQGMYFLHTYSWKYREDETLFRGLGRLSEELAKARGRKELLPVAKFAEEVLRGMRSSRPAEVDRLLEELQRLR